MRRSVSRAFTLVELVVVIVIVAILATVAFVAYNSSVEQFEQSAAEQSATQVSKLYQADSAVRQAPIVEQYVYDEDLSTLPFAQDLPADVTGVEVWEDGTLYVYQGDRECQGPAFSSTPGASPVGEWDCSYVNGAAPPSGPEPISSVAYPSSSFTVGSAGGPPAPNVTGGTAPYVFAASGVLPDGVSFDTATGEFAFPDAGDWPADVPRVIGGGGNGSSAFVMEQAVGGGTYVGGLGQATLKAGASLTSTLGSRGYLGKYDASGELLWFLPIDNSSAIQSMTTQLTPTSDGGVVALVAGFGGDFEFGGQVFTSITSGWDSHAVKFDASGNIEWSVWVPVTPIVEPDGSLVVAFAPYQETILGGLTVDGTGKTVFVARLSSGGVWQWATPVDVAGASSLVSGSVVKDGAGYVLAGAFRGDLDLGPAAFSSTGIDGYAARLDSAGDFVWTKQLSGAGDEWLTPLVAYSAGGFLLVVESFSGSVSDLDGEVIPSGSGRMKHYTKFTRLGGFVWSVPVDYPDETPGASFSLTVGGEYSDGSLLIFGEVSRATVDLGAYSATPPVSLGRSRPYVARLSDAGEWEWVTSLLNDDYVALQDVEVGPGSSVYVSGYFSGGDLTIGATTLVSDPGYRAFAAEVSSGGVWQWATQADGAGYSMFTALSVEAGRLVVYGEFDAEPDYGPVTLSTGGYGRGAALAWLGLDGQWPSAGLSSWPATVDVTVTDGDDPVGVTQSVTLLARIAP